MKSKIELPPKSEGWSKLLTYIAIASSQIEGVVTTRKVAKEMLRKIKHRGIGPNK